MLLDKQNSIHFNLLAFPLLQYVQFSHNRILTSCYLHHIIRASEIHQSNENYLSRISDNLTLEMSVVSLLGVKVLNNPAKFGDSYHFEITFECLEQLQKGVHCTSASQSR